MSLTCGRQCRGEECRLRGKNEADFLCDLGQVPCLLWAFISPVVSEGVAQDGQPCDGVYIVGRILISVIDRVKLGKGISSEGWLRGLQFKQGSLGRPL